MLLLADFGRMGYGARKERGWGEEVGRVTFGRIG